MKVAILGAGAIGFANAAFLASRGHEPILWSPSGTRTEKITSGELLEATGALSGAWKVSASATVGDAVSQADAVVLATDAAGHSSLLKAAAPYLREGQPFIISAAYALSSLHLSKALSARGVKLPIISWSATIGTAHQDSLTQVNVRVIRPIVDFSVMGERQDGEGLAACQALFGDRFRQRDNALEIALLANCNPVFHVPVTLLNVGRVDHHEAWTTYRETTESIGRLIESLDAERLSVAKAFGFSIQSVNEHFHRSFSVPLGSMTHMMKELFDRGLKPKGATKLSHRHFSQDIPYGLVFASEIAGIAGDEVPIHDSVVTLASVALGQNFRNHSSLSSVLDSPKITKPELLQLARHGQW